MLGVRLDALLSFTQHSYNIALKVQRRFNVLKPLTGSNWGCDKETLLTTYRQLAAQYSATAAPSRPHHLGTLTGAVSNLRKICHLELPLAVLK